MVDKWMITIPTLSGSKERRAYVYLPTSYQTKKKKRYPVLYMFDGHNVFFDEDATYGKSWGMSAYLDYTDTEIIVAAVECNHEGNKRLEEYSPISFHDYEFGDVEGKGQIYMDWLVNVFKPYVDEHYRTRPSRENTMIAGSSMGGLMALYAVSVYNATFSKAAALSPSLWVSGKEVMAFLKGAHLKKDTVLYMDYGSKEMVNHSEENAIFRSVTDYLIRIGVNVTSRIVKGGTHSEASWEKQIPVFMKCLGY